MRVLLAWFWLSISVAALGCRDSITRPAYFVGPASYAVVVAPDGTATTFYRVGDTLMVAHPGDSICVHFAADGNWQTLHLTNAVWPNITVGWVPHEAYRHLSVNFWGSSWESPVAASPC